MINTKDKFITHSNFSEVLRKLSMYRKAVDHKNHTYNAIYEELAEHTGLTVNAIMRMKQNFSNPSFSMAISIAEYLDIRVDQIWSIEENPNYIDQRERCKQGKCNKLSLANNLCAQHYGIEKTKAKQEKQKKTAQKVL